MYFAIMPAATTKALIRGIDVRTKQLLGYSVPGSDVLTPTRCRIEKILRESYFKAWGPRVGQRPDHSLIRSWTTNSSA